jgi:thioredoxin-dependent peroxiredoxin
VAKLKTDATAPAFALEDQHGSTVKLSDFKGKRLVVYFYPKADTPGCTTQSCAVRDALPMLKRLKANVVAGS